MTSRTGTAEKRRAGRPRPPATDQSILRATLELLSEGGAEAATIDAIARRSGSAKTTIYRRWPSREALILDAMRAAVRGSAEQVEEARELHRPLGSTIRGSARNFVTLVQSPVFRAAFPTIAHELLGETELGEAFRADVFRPIRARVKELLREEVDRGELRPDVDTDLVLDLVNGALLYRALVGGQLDEAVADALAEIVLAGARRPAPPAGPARGTRGAHPR